MYLIEIASRYVPPVWMSVEIVHKIIVTQPQTLLILCPGIFKPKRNALSILLYGRLMSFGVNKRMRLLLIPL